MFSVANIESYPASDPGRLRPGGKPFPRFLTQGGLTYETLGTGRKVLLRVCGWVDSRSGTVQRLKPRSRVRPTGGAAASRTRTVECGHAGTDPQETNAIASREAEKAPVRRGVTAAAAVPIRGGRQHPLGRPNACRRSHLLPPDTLPRQLHVLLTEEPPTRAHDRKAPAASPRAVAREPVSHGTTARRWGQPS